MITAIIQARVGSTRLPGKVLANIMGKPLLVHVIERVKRTQLVEEIVLATTTNKADEVILRIASENNVHGFAGSEADVLDRYYQAAKKYHANVIVRVTGDDPLTDPQVIDTVIRYYLDEMEHVDYVSNNLKATYPEGLDVEVFSFNALENAWKNAKLPSEREHVTPYIRNHPEIFRLGNIECEEDLSHLRWTVDNKKDLLFVEKVYQKLYTSTKEDVFLMQDVLLLLKENPELMEINKGIARREGYLKSLEMDEKLKLSKGGV